MKKTLLALSVLVASGAANAGIEIYKKDGASVALSGDIEVLYKKDTEDGSEFQQEIDDADFGFDVRYEVNDNLKVGGFWEFSGDKGNADTGDAYIGFYMVGHTIKVGKTTTILDDAGVTSDYEFGVTKFIEGVDFSGDEVVKYQFDNGSVYAGAALMQDKNGNQSGVGTDEVYFDANLGVRTDSGFDLSIWYGTTTTDADADIDLLAAEVRYAVTQELDLELGYYDMSDVGSSIALGAAYTMDKWKYAVGASLTDFEASDDDQLSYFVNAGYGLAPGTTVYAELGGNDKDDSELGMALGMKVEF